MRRWLLAALAAAAPATIGCGFHDDVAPASGVHAEGPTPGDAVVVTDVAVVKAIVEERLTMAEALAGGMLRIYPAH